MSLINWAPLNGFEGLFVERLSNPSSRPSWDLSVDVYEEDEFVIAKMNLPDINMKDIEITFEDNVLTIAGKREEEKTTDNRNYYSKEIRRGSFSRSVRLPKYVEVKKAEARYKEGVLTVTAPVLIGAEDKVVKVKVK